MPAASDPNLTRRVAKELVGIYGDAVVDILGVVARRLRNGIDSPGWQERKLLELSAMRDDVIGVIERLDRAGPEAISRALGEGAEAGARAAAQDLDVSATLGQRGQRATVALAEETVGQVRDTHPRILRQATDIYRSTIAEAASSPLTGTRTRRDAAAQALDRFARQGITGFVDRFGRAWDLASYTEMAMRTSIGRAQIAGAVDRFQADGRDLVLVSVSPEPCPVCTPWEDEILSISGTDDRYPSQADAEADGLFHANCTHRLHAWVQGLSRQIDPEPDPQDYEDRQQQRYLERGIREWKQREAVSINERGRRHAQSKVAEWQERMRSFLDEKDRIRQRAREQLGAR